MILAFFLYFVKVAAGGDNGKLLETTESSEAAEKKALAKLGALVEKKAEATKQLTGASLESVLAGMEVSGK